MGLTDDQLTFLLPTLTELSLSELILSQNQLGNDSSEPLTKLATKKDSKLNILVLDSNKFTDLGAVQLGTFLDEKRTVRLSLINNDISDEVIEQLNAKAENSGQFSAFLP